MTTVTEAILIQAKMQERYGYETEEVKKICDAFLNRAPPTSYVALSRETKPGEMWEEKEVPLPVRMLPTDRQGL